MKLTAPQNGNGYKEMLKANQSRAFLAFNLSKPAQDCRSPWEHLDARVSEDESTRHQERPHNIVKAHRDECLLMMGEIKKYLR